MDVLVTGGAGYVGSHVCKLLAKRGMKPTTFDSLERGFADAVKWGPLVKGNLTDYAAIREALGAKKFGAVFHFAAFAYVGESVAQPDRYYHNNVVGTLNLVRAMLETGVDRLVFSSTCAIYGTPDVVPITESIKQAPISPYGASKQMAERVIRDVCDTGKLRCVALRYFNAAGCDPDGELGERHEPETHLIPLVIDAALGRRAEIVIYGDDYPTPDGTCIRDYVHVDDLGQAHVLALDAMAQRPGMHAYNLGYGRGYSVLEVIQSVERISGRKVPRRVGPKRAGDPPELIADSQSVRAALGWRPQYNDLDEVVRTAWASRTKESR